MPLIIQPTIGTNGKEKGKILNQASVYHPDQRVKDRMADVNKIFSIGEEIMSNAYEEYSRDKNGELLNLVGRLNENQKKFNNYLPPRTSDPDLDWHSQIIRPLTRNKVISIIAHITNSVMYPGVIAQNDSAEEDKDMAMVLEDGLRWSCDQMDYEDHFINFIQDFCVNPAIILFTDYADVKRSIKEIMSKGNWTNKEIVDELYSGFQMSIVPCDELYIGNFYEPNIQKQPFLIRRKIISFEEAEAKYKSHKDFKFVSPGVKLFFSEAEDTYYQAYDDDLEQRLVEEVTIYNRSADLELVIVNGVMITDPDQPLRRKDKMYPFAKSYFEPFNSRAFYGMSVVQKLAPEQDVIDTVYNMILDSSYLKMMPPINVYGAEELGAADFNPNSINRWTQTDTKVEPMSIGNDINSGLVALKVLEGSMSESSQSPRQQGIETAGSQTKYEVQRLETNARTVLGMAGKMVGFLVRDFGQLVLGNFLQYIPIADVEKMVGDEVVYKFPSLFLKESKVEGQTKAKKIEFTNELPEAETDEELREKEMEGSREILIDEDKLGMSIVKARPSALKNLKYYIKVEPEFVSKDSIFAKRMMLYDRLVGNPLVKQETLLLDTILKELAPGDEDRYLASKTANPILDMVQKNSNLTKKPAAQPAATAQPTAAMFEV